MEENTTHIITLEEIKSTLSKINKKIILVNSSKYTEEAFEYLLDLADASESIVFVINERKIYTHGEYFGGDLWEDSLNYFSKYTILNDNNEIISQIYAQVAKDAIQMKGEGGVEIYTDYDIQRDANTLHIKYDLNAAVDLTSIVEVNGEYLTLSVEDKKLGIIKYQPIKVNLPLLPIAEYDSGNITVEIPISINGADRLQRLSVTASGGAIPMYDLETKTINVTIFNNIKTTIYVDYTDGRLPGKSSTTQDWGYAFIYSDNQITKDTFDLLKLPNDIENRFVEKTINLNIRDEHFGWFAYPSNVDLQFTDLSTGFSGGWQKYSKFTKYEQEIEYQVYRTEHLGLGQTKWKITKK